LSQACVYRVITFLNCDRYIIFHYIIRNSTQKDGVENIILKCVVIPTNDTEHIKGNQISEIQNINIVTVEKKILNAHEKYRSAHVEANRLSSLASEATGKQFEPRFMILKYIANAWEQDKNITTTEIDL